MYVSLWNTASHVLKFIIIFLTYSPHNDIDIFTPQWHRHISSHDEFEMKADEALLPRVSLAMLICKLQLHGVLNYKIIFIPEIGY